LLLPHGARLLAVQLTSHFACRAAALPHILDAARQKLNNSIRGSQRTLIDFNQGQPNNGMHPTANSAAFIENLRVVAVRRGG
jgi:hypothetical protein